MEKYKSKILELVDYIEENTSRELNLEGISREFHLSPFHLHRVFNNLTGQPLMGYIRGRKLAHSLKDLTVGRYKIIDIAMNYGFSHEQSYIRAFKTAFGLTPASYRKTRQPLEITAKLSLGDLAIIGNGLILPPAKRFLPQINLIGKSIDLDQREEDFLTKPNRAGQRFVKEESLQIQGEINREVYYGLVKNIDLSRGIYQYMPAFSYRGSPSQPQDMEFHSIPQGEYISFKYMGNHSPYEIDMLVLSQSYQYIGENFSDYIAKHCDGGFKLERIDNELCGPDYSELDFFYRLID